MRQKLRRLFKIQADTRSGPWETSFSLLISNGLLSNVRHGDEHDWQVALIRPGVSPIHPTD
ncbi:hypothetical protein J2X72_000612 [Phyllobacterium sp. 1468]|nr:hypothetical protein [Phyllobacterium sp. 1468]